MSLEPNSNPFSEQWLGRMQSELGVLLSNALLSDIKLHAYEQKMVEDDTTIRELRQRVVALTEGKEQLRNMLDSQKPSRGRKRARD